MLATLQNPKHYTCHMTTPKRLGWSHDKNQKRSGKSHDKNPKDPAGYITRLICYVAPWHNNVMMENQSNINNNFV